MGRVKPIPVDVEWSSKVTPTDNICLAEFADSANKPTILKEILNAPISTDSMDARVYRYKHKIQGKDNNSASVGYVENLLEIVTSKHFDASEFEEAGIPYNYIGGNELYKDETPRIRNHYYFDVSPKGLD